jgi:hypothetical protein
VLLTAAVSVSVSFCIPPRSSPSRTAPRLLSYGQQQPAAKHTEARPIMTDAKRLCSSTGGCAENERLFVFRRKSQVNKGQSKKSRGARIHFGKSRRG